MTPHHYLQLTIFAVAFLCHQLPASAWLQSSPTNVGLRRTVSDSSTIRHDVMCRMASRKVVDADFERVDLSKPKAKKTKAKKAEKEVSSISSDDTSNSPKSLLDMSFELDPDWKEARIPFVDTRTEGESYIDAKLAFTVDLDGVTYGIAVPFDHGAAIVFEKPEGDVVYLSPDDDENVELMEIMARQLQEHVDEELKLQRTPRILTISGDLSKYTAKWKDELVPKPVDVDTLLDDGDETVEFFREFMRQELGEEEYAKTIRESATMSSEEVNEAMLELFNIPGMGESMDDLDGIEKMLKSMLAEEDEEDVKQKKSPFPGVDNENLDHDGVALKLISYKFADGKAYSLVYLLKPFTLVGKYVSEESDIRFELLQPDEEKLVIPRIEELCREDIQRAGLTLAPR